MMPVESGLAALETILQINPKAKVIMLLSMGTKEMVELFLQRGASRVVQTPFVKGELLDHLRQSKNMELMEMAHSD